MLPWLMFFLDFKRVSYARCSKFESLINQSEAKIKTKASTNRLLVKADFHPTLIRTSFIHLSCSFVLGAKADRFVTRALSGVIVNFAKCV